MLSAGVLKSVGLCRARDEKVPPFPSGKGGTVYEGVRVGYHGPRGTPGLGLRPRPRVAAK